MTQKSKSAPSKNKGQGPEAEVSGPPIARLTRPFLHFMEKESSSGLLLLACAILALVVMNSGLAWWWESLWQTPVSFRLGDFELNKNVGLLINDGLMTLFFFVVGLEIKRELVIGELQHVKAAFLPAMAALGGMVAPALIYLGVLGDAEGQSGWGIPMATDIAFVVGFLALLGKRVPHGLKIFILSLAIVDDMGAVLVIALFYTAQVSTVALGVAALGLCLVLAANKLGVRSISVYIALGSIVWLACLKSGIHPTVAGVILGLMTPVSALIPEKALWTRLEKRIEAHKRDKRAAWNANELERLVTDARESISPLERLESSMHPWVAFFIMPVFALANAGVAIAGDVWQSPVALAITAGLVIGKPLGILVFSWVAVQTGSARLPQGVDWALMAGASCLAGVGFTMSLFIASLGLPAELLEAGKLGTLLGSLISACLGLGLLLWALKRQRLPSSPAHE
jgi:NhaA family Na+:H+ antiporter